MKSLTYELPILRVGFVLQNKYTYVLKQHMKDYQ